MNKVPIGQCGSCQGYIEKCSSETFSALIVSNALLICVGVAYIVFTIFGSRTHDLNVNLKIDKSDEDGSEDGSEESTCYLSQQNENVFQQKVCCNFQYFDNCSLCNTVVTTKETTETTTEETTEEPTEETTEETTETTTEDIIILN